MINLHERMLPTSAEVEPATSWSPVGRHTQLSHRGQPWPGLVCCLVPYIINWFTCSCHLWSLGSFRDLWRFIWGSLMRPNWSKLVSIAQNTCYLAVFSFASAFICSQESSLQKHAYSNIWRILPPKNEKFQMKNSSSFHVSAKNIDCRQGDSNEYPQSMF